MLPARAIDVMTTVGAARFKITSELLDTDPAAFEAVIWNW
jgi:hypothetical protein